MGSKENMVEKPEGIALPLSVAHGFDLFVAHAAADADFVRGYLLPSLNLPTSHVLLIDDLPLGGMVVTEIDRAVSCSRFTVAVLSPAYLADRWAMFGEQLASHLGANDACVIPLRLIDDLVGHFLASTSTKTSGLTGTVAVRSTTAHERLRPAVPATGRPPSRRPESG